MTDEIRDLPQVQEAIQSAETMEALGSIFEDMKPVLESIGVDTSTIEHTLNVSDDPGQFTEDLSEIPDRFNEIFASRGWIMYENMNFNVAKEAVEIADSPNSTCPDDGRSPVDIAEESLVSYYDRSTIQFQLKKLKQIDAFGPRRGLAYKALDDYDASRYHASIPVVLSIIDGLVLQISSDTNEGANYGAFTNKADLTAWDSVAAYGGGLERLFDDEHLNQSRNTTTVDPITMPYRHGILHGQDVGYDTRPVAAKAWAALFAVGEWALKTEQDELEEPTREHSDSPADLLEEAIKTHYRTQEIKRRVREWEPRELVLTESDLTTDPSDYPQDSPEQAMVTFLAKWKAKNYGHMANYLRGRLVKPGFIREQFENTDLESFWIRDVTDRTAVKTEVQVRMDLLRFGTEERVTAAVQLIHFAPDNDETVFRDEDGRWLIVDWRKLLVAD